MKTHSRFGHSEGITDLCVVEDKQKLLTCGSDGDIRIWEGFDDPDPKAFSASDSALALHCSGNIIYVGTENHTVEAYELDTGKRIGNGIKAKFRSAVNHFDVTEDGKLMIAGSGDMTVQIINLEGNSAPIKLEAHSAPVLSIAIDPLLNYFASSGCDGNLHVWTLSSGHKLPLLAKTWENVIRKSADISISESLCRIRWIPKTGAGLAVPLDNRIMVYRRDDWSSVKCYECDELDHAERISVVKFSNCGKYIVGGCCYGKILMWNAVNAELLFKHSLESKPITGIAVKSYPIPQIYAVDLKGKFYYISDLRSRTTKASVGSSADTRENLNSNLASPEVENDRMFDDDDDDLFNMDGGFTDENEFSISKIKAEVGFIDDVYVGANKASLKQIANEDSDRMSVRSIDGSESFRSSRLPISQCVDFFSEQQRPFQPTSTPKHLKQRFMVWNNVGIIRCYNSEEDNAIDVEFHDPAHHHNMHLRNQFEYSMGTLSSEAIVLACGKGIDHPSKLFCVNYVSWDSSKEWAVDMPDSEELTAVGMGKNWIVGTTNLHRVRLYSLSGVQYFIYDLPGQVVAVAGFMNMLFVTYHYGLGFQGSQSLFYSVFLVNQYALRPLIQHAPLSLSASSTLSWIGFSEEGTPAFCDTSDTLRILNGHLWTPFCNMREFLSGPNDHFWVVGLSQLTQNVRAVKCKGAKYPPTLPRPIQIILDAKIPLCESDTQKTQLEDEVLRSLMTTAVSKKMDSKGFDTEDYKTKAREGLVKSILNLFDLSIQANRDFRGSDYISLMPIVKGIQAAVKLASQHRKNALVERLRAMAQRKLELHESDEDEDDFEIPKLQEMSVDSFSVSTEQTSQVLGSYNQECEDSTEARLGQSAQDKTSARLGVENPLLKKQKDKIRNLLCPPQVRKSNPFRVQTTEVETNQYCAQSVDKGTAFIEAWKKLPEKAGPEEFNPKHLQKQNAPSKKSNSFTLRPKQKSSGNKKQATLFEMQNKSGNPNSDAMSHTERNLFCNNELKATHDAVELELEPHDYDSSELNGTEIEEIGQKRKRPRSGIDHVRTVEDNTDEDIPPLSKLLDMEEVFKMANKGPNFGFQQSKRKL